MSVADLPLFSLLEPSNHLPECQGTLIASPSSVLFLMSMYLSCVRSSRSLLLLMDLGIYRHLASERTDGFDWPLDSVSKGATPTLLRVSVDIRVVQLTNS